MTWVEIGKTINGDVLYGRIDDDGLMRVTCIAEHPEFAAWVAAGGVPEAIEP